MKSGLMGRSLHQGHLIDNKCSNVPPCSALQGSQSEFKEGRWERGGWWEGRCHLDTVVMNPTAIERYVEGRNGKCIATTVKPSTIKRMSQMAELCGR